MSNKPKRRKRPLLGLLQASVLALVCVCVAAEYIESRDGHWLIHQQWPHLHPLLAPLVLGPAIAFWWFYFAYYWRGHSLSRRNCGRNQKPVVLGHSLARSPPLVHFLLDDGPGVKTQLTTNRMIPLFSVPTRWRIWEDSKFSRYAISPRQIRKSGTLTKFRGK